MVIPLPSPRDDPALVMPGVSITPGKRVASIRGVVTTPLRARVTVKLTSAENP